jgi:hypothetical protein
VLGERGKRMKIPMKAFPVVLLMFTAAALAQAAIPVGTVLPVQLSSSLNSRSSKVGQGITARIMQDVPLSSGKKIRAGAKVVGQVVRVKAAQNGQPGQITVRFDRLESAHQSVPINTNLRALASMMEVADAQVPPMGPDRGTPWAWETRNLIEGEVAYGQGGPVVHGGEIVGQSLFGGVLVPAKANPGSGCRGEVGGNTQPQAFWVFASDACGVYGMDDVQISHAGRTAPLGQIMLTAKSGNVNIRSGSGMLLRVNGDTLKE